MNLHPMLVFNPPGALILTAAEIFAGSVLVANDWRATGGLAMGLAIGTFVSRAMIPLRLARLVRSQNQ